MEKNESDSTPNENAVEKEALVIYIPETLETFYRTPYSVHKDPDAIRALDPAAYTPQVISIGLVHHSGKKALEKVKTLKAFCERFIGIEKNESASTSNKNAVEKEALVIRIPETLENFYRNPYSVYKVPDAIRALDPAAYTPQVISIGPVHHSGEKALEKARTLKAFCERFIGMEQDKVLRKLQGIIKNMEHDIRLCYEDKYTANFCSDKFVEMILYDAVFIIELFLQEVEEWHWENAVKRKAKKHCHETRNNRSHFIIAQRKLIGMDLLLVDNQLPLFVFTGLYKFYSSKSNHHLDKHFHELAFSCFWVLFIRNPDIKCWTQALSLASEADPKNLIDLARSIMLNGQISQSDELPVKLRYNAVKLRQAGVNFKVAKEKNSFLDIEFERGVLKIPRIELHHSSECFYRNIMALEQCRYPFETYICNYFFLMDHLINTEQDVDLLVDAGIIVNWLGSNHMVADLINRLCQGLDEQASRYTQCCIDLNNYCEELWNRRKAALKQIYFNNVWRGTGTVAAALLLIMTLVQTIASLKSVL